MSHGLVVVQDREDHARTFAVRDVAAAKPAISVVGLGYVGAVSMACLAKLGFRMVGVDISADRVSSIKNGQAPIVEKDLGHLLQRGVADGLIDATDDLVTATLETDVTFVSVGTPTAPDGSCDLTYVRQASRAIGQALAMKDGFHVVVLRCSVPPGTTLNVVGAEIEKASGRMLGVGFGLCFNPEFLREGVAVADFFEPPKTVVGASDARSEAIVSRIYSAIDPKTQFVNIEAAELIKYADNVWHATKVAFANEIGRLCKALDVDSHEVMDVFVTDTKLNLSPYYMRPGFAFGGSCLPKEVRAVAHLGRSLDVDLPLIDSLMPSNQTQIALAEALLGDTAGKRIGFLGITFKPGTDDLRESPTIELMSRLKQRGVAIAAYDPNVVSGPALEGQVAYVRHACPPLVDLMDHLEDLTVETVDDLLAWSDVLVVSHATDEFRTAVARRRPDVLVVDLVRLSKALPDDEAYTGIAW